MLEKAIEALIAQSPGLAVVAIILLLYGGKIATLIRTVLDEVIAAGRQRDKMEMQLSDLSRRVGLIEIEIVGERSPTNMRRPTNAQENGN